MALGPLWFPEWWRRRYPAVAIALAGLVVLYYLFDVHAAGRVWETAREYVSFMALVGSLFVVSGGIHITVKGEATPLANVLFLLVGALVSNLLGTTGASMLLIRPWLRMNKYRVTAHHVVFFIFLVSNVGGCLTPIADPPLFLGYLAGVPFWWTAARCLPIWCAGVGILLGMFWLVDRKNYAKAPKEVRAELTASEQWRFEGLGNLFFLAVILGATILNHPTLLREFLMIGAALGSYFTTSKAVHESNDFNFGPVREVAILFIGIFGTMMPALDWLQANASHLDRATPGLFYFGTGMLSSVLDNAPTYLCFLKVIFGRFVPPGLVGQVAQYLHTGGAGLSGAHATEVSRTVQVLQFTTANAASCTDDQIRVAYIIGNLRLNVYLLAVSIGAVFFGANTYIANGPNFLVKAIADHQKVKTPTFLEYVWKFTLPFMLPMLMAVWLLFFFSAH